jgi:ATP-dependent protease HslVU (ClpYQ) peptidase subunit
MTIIAAIQAPSSILMGGDSAQHANGSITIVLDPKIFQNGDYLFGVAGSPRIAEIVQYEFHPPVKIQSMTWKEFLVRSFLPKLKTALGPESSLQKSGLLVATKGGGIFEVSDNWFVEQSRDPYAAIGSGASYALGSFHSTSGNPRRRLLKAMRAAAHLNAYVRPPFSILELPAAGLDEAIWGSIAELSDPAAKYEIDPDDQG